MAPTKNFEIWSNGLLVHCTPVIAIIISSVAVHLLILSSGWRDSAYSIPFSVLSADMGTTDPSRLVCICARDGYVSKGSGEGTARNCDRYR
jgi:hypothetical protein